MYLIRLVCLKRCCIPKPAPYVAGNKIEVIFHLEKIEVVFHLKILRLPSIIHKIRLHTENQLPGLPGSALKVQSIMWSPLLRFVLELGCDSTWRQWNFLHINEGPGL